MGRFGVCMHLAALVMLVREAGARTLSQRGTPSAANGTGADWESGATSVFDRQQCGRLGQACCEVEYDDYRFVEICDGDALYCLNFPGLESNDSDSNPDLASGDGGVLRLSLCLPKPDGCGAASGGVCCPLTGDKSNTTQRCGGTVNSICLAPDSDSITGLLTYQMYTQLQQDPQASLSSPVARSVWGTCQAFDPAACGTQGGLCGPALQPPGPVCREESSTCQQGLFCQEQEGQFEDFGLCEPIPAGCGQLGAACCPYGNYTQGSFQSPFCWQDNVYCAAQADNITDAVCLQLPGAADCGTEAGPCCPSPVGLVTDKPLPPMCQGDLYCNVTAGSSGTAEGGSGSGGTCVRNEPNCGRIAKPCCVVNGRSGLVFTCDDGFYCPDPGDESGSTPGGGDGSTDGGVLMAVGAAGDRICQECTPLVPAQYQSMCGFGIISGGNDGEDGQDDYACNTEDYYCDYYAPAPAPGPLYGGQLTDGGPAASLQQGEEELPPLGPPQLDPAVVSAPQDLGSALSSQKLGVAELAAPADLPRQQASTPASAPTPAQAAVAAPAPAPQAGLALGPEPTPSSSSSPPPLMPDSARALVSGVAAAYPAVAPAPESVAAPAPGLEAQLEAPALSDVEPE